jgi:predicted outer membrane repeat protein
MTRVKFITIIRGILLALLITMTPSLGLNARPSAALAATNSFTVNSTADLPDVDVGISTCQASNNLCTLRAAIMQANFTAGADIITIPAGLFQLTRAGNDDAAVLGDLDITDDLTIQGAGSGLTIIDGNGAVTGDRVFQILSSAKSVTISGLTIRNGKRTNTFDEGGGLYWDGNGSYLNLSNVVFENNAGYYGGGLYLNYSSLGDVVNLDHLTVHANTAATASAGGMGVNFGESATFDLRASQVYSNTAYEGGGIYFQTAQPIIFGLSSVRIENTAVYSNTATLSAGFENHSGSAAVPIELLNSNLYNNRASLYGGAIGNYGNLTVLTTTLSANSAVVRGGGLYDYEGGQVNVEQSTLSGNAAQTGGGIYSEFFIHNTAGITLTNSTLSGNTASHDGGGIYADGGQIILSIATIASNQIQASTGITYTGTGSGIYINPRVVVIAGNTLLADNTHRYQALPVVPDDCQGTINSFGYNFIETTNNCTISGFILGNITGQDPNLAPLGNYGGLTQTQLPVRGSPVIDSGNSTILIDQRGFHRPQGAATDIGAAEAFPNPLFLPVVQK